MVKPLRVLEIITVPIAENGLALYPIRMAEKMDARVQIDFLACYAEPELKTRIENRGAKLHLAPSRLRSPVSYMRFVEKTVRENGYSVVHAHGNSCTLALDLIAARRGGAKMRIAHSHNTSCRFRVLNALLRPAFERAYTDALACGEAAGEWLFRKRPFEIMPNAIDLSAFKPDAKVRGIVRREFGADGRRVLLHIGNFSEAKNPMFLIEIMERLDDSFVLWMVGDGRLRAETEACARAKGLESRIVFTGARGDVPRIMQGADALLLPSKFEGFPTVALEAQAAGLRTLMSDYVTKKVAFSECAAFLPLNPDRWTKCIQNAPETNRAQAAENAANALAARGYELESAARRLEERYLEKANG